jgi:DNA ligase (NAD+)
MDQKENNKNQKKRLEELHRDIHFHNYRYHVLDDPVISDLEFDRFLAELRQIESDHPAWVSPDSPTQRIGGQPAERFTKVQHPAPILSLANAFGGEDVVAWYERLLRLDERVAEVNFVLEPKFDGLTVVLRYEDGRFVQGATRGNGEVGEDITSNLRTIRSLPLRIPVSLDGPQPPPLIVVRGEVFINIKDFEELNHRLEMAGDKTYLNPRNTAAGSLRQLDPALTATRPLNLLVYAIISSDQEVPRSQWKRLDYLGSLGFPVTKNVKRFENIDAAIKECEVWSERRSDLPFEIDGMVIKIDDLEIAADLGFVGKDPRGAIAYKFPAQEVTTRLLDIGVNVGRTGVLTPYAILDPIEIGGVIVKQATLHNFDFIAKKDVRVTDRVRVKRAGDVIPYVIGPVTNLRTGDEKKYKPPSNCPVCGEPVENLPGEVAWYCVNAACPEQLIRNVEHFVSRGAMDIVGLGIKIVVQLVESGLINDVADLYSLDRVVLLELDGFAEKKADNLLQSIDISRGRSLRQLVTALGIRGVGEAVAADLTRYFSDLDSLSIATVDDLVAIEGIGPNIAQAIVDWFARPSNRKVLDKLREAWVWPVSDAVSPEPGIDLPLYGKTFVITGTLPSLTRQDAKTLIQNQGGKVVGTVSKKTSYVLVGKKPGSKLIKAQSMGVQTLDEEGILKLIDSGQY